MTGEQKWSADPLSLIRFIPSKAQAAAGHSGLRGVMFGGRVHSVGNLLHPRRNGNSAVFLPASSFGPGTGKGRHRTKTGGKLWRGGCHSEPAISMGRKE